MEEKAEVTIVDSFDGLWDRKASRDRRGWFRCKHNQGLWFDWPDKRTYQRRTGRLRGEEATVATCPQCGRRILCQMVGQLFSSPNAEALIDDEIAKLGKNPRYSNDGRHNYGSGWYCELPNVVSSILEDKGEEAARTFVRRQFGKGGCQEAFNILYGGT